LWWFSDWKKSASVVNSLPVDDFTICQLGFDLPQHLLLTKKSVSDSSRPLCILAQEVGSYNQWQSVPLARQQQTVSHAQLPTDQVGS